jgi:hypothetical protein
MRCDLVGCLFVFLIFSRYASKETASPVGELSDHDVSLMYPVSLSLHENGTLDSSRWRDSPKKMQPHKQQQQKRTERERPRQTESLRDSPGHNPHAANEYSLLLIRFTTSCVVSPLLNLCFLMFFFLFLVFFKTCICIFCFEDRDDKNNNRCYVVNEILSGFGTCQKRKSRFKYLF